MPREADLLEWLRTAEDRFPPLRIRVKDTDVSAEHSGYRVDVLVEVGWQSRRHIFAAELKALSTPKALETAAEAAKRGAKQRGCHPMVVTAYLRDDQLQWLERHGVSGFDICGNGVVTIPPRLLVYRTGAPNEYPRSTTIRNIYRGVSSIVARMFLLLPQYQSTLQVEREIRLRGARVTLPTISKVCAALSEDLIIDRSWSRGVKTLRLLQPEKLLDALASGYEPPRVMSRFIGKCAIDPVHLLGMLPRFELGRLVRTGADSAAHYATMAREPVRRFYCSALSELLNRLGTHVTETSRFPNVEFLETDDPAVYFDARDDLLSSPIQCYLELASGDKREQETAEQVRRRLLRTIDEWKSKDGLA